jgi:lipopolysaccharide export system protein LptA
VDEAQEKWKKQKGKNEKWYYKVWEDTVEIEEKELVGEEVDQVEEGEQMQCKRKN